MFHNLQIDLNDDAKKYLPVTYTKRGYTANIVYNKCGRIFTLYQNQRNNNVELNRSVQPQDSPTGGI